MNITENYDLQQQCKLLIFIGLQLNLRKYQLCTTILFITARQRSSGKVMFSIMSVSLFTGAIPCDHDPWCSGPHYTGKRCTWNTPPRFSFLPLCKDNHSCSKWTSQTMFKLPSLWNIYGWQASVWHPTGKLSCLALLTEIDTCDVNLHCSKWWNISSDIYRQVCLYQAAQEIARFHRMNSFSFSLTKW